MSAPKLLVIVVLITMIAVALETDASNFKHRAHSYTNTHTQIMPALKKAPTTLTILIKTPKQRRANEQKRGGKVKALAKIANLSNPV
jgi:hypothetical protein